MIIQNICERCGKEGTMEDLMEIGVVTVGVEYFKRRWYLCGSCSRKFVDVCQNFIKQELTYETKPERVTTGGIEPLKIEKRKGDK
jgi:hypothetical protein